MKYGISSSMIASDELHQIYCNVPQCYPWRVNQLGGQYVNGKPLPQELRMQILQYAESGVRPCDISRQMKITHGCISKLLTKYKKTGSLTPGSEKAAFIEQSKKRLEDSPYQSRQRPILPNIWSGKERTLQTTAMYNTISIGDLSKETRRELSSENQTEIMEEQQLHNFQKEGKESSNSTPYKHSIEEILSLTREKGATTKTVEATQAMDSFGVSESLSSIQVTSAQRPSIHRIHFSTRQLHILQAEFMVNQYPGIPERQAIARNLDVNENKVKIWFSNARAKRRQNKNRSRVKTNPSSSHKIECSFNDCFYASFNNVCCQSSFFL